MARVFGKAVTPLFLGFTTAFIALGSAPAGLANKPTVQQLPNGTYFYGETNTANGRGKQYVILKKVGSTVTGFEYATGTDASSCFTGTVKGNKLTNALLAFLTYDRGGSGWAIKTQPVFDLATISSRDSLKYRLNFNQANSRIKGRLQECITVLSKKR